MKVALFGSFQSGQQQLFSLLTGIALDNILQKPLEVHQGVASVRDPRIIALQQIFNPKKTTFSQIEFLLLPDLDLSNQAFINQLKNADELCFIVRTQEAEQKISALLSELSVRDFMLAEKRLENMAKEKQRKNISQQEVDLIEQSKQALEQEKRLINLPFAPDQTKLLRTYQFLTLKPIVIVLNTTEKELKDTSLSENIRKKYQLPTIQLSIEIEEEISQLPQEEQAEFLKDIGIEQPAIDKISCLAFEGLGLISFFTVGEDEVRAWPIHKGSTAQEAGAAIHTDIARGFVRAEMMKYADFMGAKSEAKLKETGKFYLKGKDYIVEDGDLLSFRFSV